MCTLEVNVHAFHFEPASKFDTADKVLFTATTFTLLADASQTMQIQYHEGHYEKNLILGKHPSNEKVAVYFAAIIGGVYGISRYALDDYWRKIYLAGVGIYHGQAVVRNESHGLTSGFVGDDQQIDRVAINMLAGSITELAVPDLPTPAKLAIATIPTMAHELTVDRYIDSADIFFNLVSAYVGIRLTKYGKSVYYRNNMINVAGTF